MEDDTYVYGLGGGDGFMGVHPQTHRVVYINYVQLFTCQSHSITQFKKKNLVKNMGKGQKFYKGNLFD